MSLPNQYVFSELDSTGAINASAIAGAIGLRKMYVVLSDCSIAGRCHAERVAVRIRQDHPAETAIN